MKRAMVFLFAGLAAVAMAATPADAAKRKKAKPAQQAAPAVTDVNDASFRLVRDSLPLFFPTPVKMIYFASNPEARNK
jgi:hypothetical protein